ncbi:MAG: MoxR family ATPase, partial [Candidatus Aminicenantes bacterium]|nr:MoxR family ATPase [Candidatus Aminicenantes bacterium]
TLLVRTLGRALELSFSRIQFTPDLMPADITGTNIVVADAEGREAFHFHLGPIFSQLVLADEINRATPKAQSALLEAMEERQVSIDAITYSLPEPFFVIATQNQRYHVGTFPLPESQLDRFFMRIRLGYPDHAAERQLLTGENRQTLLKKMSPVILVTRLLELQEKVIQVHTSPAILDYIQNIITASRHTQQYLGLSPRAGIALLHAAQAWALTQGRDLVIPEDVQQVAGSVLEHRLNPEGSKVKGGGFSASENLISSLPVDPIS